MIRILKVKAGDDYTVEIELENGHKIIYDMKPKLKTVRFCDLSNKSLFQSVIVKENNTLFWNDLCQISVDEIISHIQR